MRVSVGINGFAERVASFGREALDDVLTSEPPALRRLPEADGIERSVASLFTPTARSAASAAVTAPAGPPVSNRHTIFSPGGPTMPQYEQTGNGCGTTSLAMILQYQTGRPYDQAKIDSAIRRTDVFTSPGDIVAYSRSQGLDVEPYNHGSPEKLKEFLDRGIALQVIVNSSGDSGKLGSLHYMAVVGYEADAAGKLSGFIVNDPATGTERTFSLEEFMKRWEAAKPGFDKFFIAHAPSGVSLPDGNWDDMQGVVGVGEHLTNVTNNFDRLVSPDSPGNFVHGLVGMYGALKFALPGVVGSGIAVGADWLGEKVEKVPVLGQIAGPVLGIIEGVGGGLSRFSTGMSNAFDHGGSAVGNLVQGNWGAAWEDTKNLGRSVWDATGGAMAEVGRGAWEGLKRLKFW